MPIECVCDELGKLPVNDHNYFPQLELAFEGTQSRSISVSEGSAGAAIELIDSFLSQVKVFVFVFF